MVEGAHLPHFYAVQVVAADGSVRYTVFDQCAVSISVEEGFGHRRSLVMQLVPRSQLPEAAACMT
jgi:exosome complex exonuclease DIS3/RRP44